MSSSMWKRIQGLVNGYLKFGFLGAMIRKNPTDNAQLDVLGNDGISDAKFDASIFKTKQIELRDANGVKTTISQPILVTDLNLRLPTNEGNPGDTLKTDGNGDTYWYGGGDAADLTAYQYSINHASASPINLVNAPNNFRVKDICFDVITPFDGAVPSVSTGISGDVAKFTENADVDLKNVGKYAIDVETDVAVAAQMIATFNASGSVAGAMTVTVSGSVPQ